MSKYPGGHGVHCEVCDHCVVLLLDDLERAGALFPTIREQLRGLNASSAAWARLHALNISIASLQDQLQSSLGSRHHAEEQLDALGQKSAKLEQDGQRLEAQASGARAQAEQLLDSTSDTQGRAQTLLDGIRAAEQRLRELEDQTDHLFPTNTSAPSGEQLRRVLAEAERLLGDLRARSLDFPKAAADAELDKAQRLLARVQEQLTRRWEANQALAAGIRDRLAQHEAGLMELREVLNQAVGTTREAQELNNRNQARLEEALRGQHLAQDNSTLWASVQSARATLAQILEQLQGLDQAREDYEHLLASLDGARTPLLERIQTFSPASSKLGLVEEAEAHARRLDKLAHNLTSIIQGVNQDRFLQRAMDAVRAYSHTLHAVQAAEKAAEQALKEAMNTWEVAVRQGLAAQARRLLANSSTLEDVIGGEQRKLAQAWATLQGTGPKLHDAQAKKDQLVSRVQAARAMLAMDTDETSRKIAHAKAVAFETRDQVAHMQSRLRDMQENVEQWQGQYGGLQTQGLGQAVADAGRSVSGLEKILPQLLTKLSDLHNRGAPNASLALAASIGRVRELIAQARGAASKVRVPMKFNGTSGVRLRAPRDLSDLAAYTSLKFYLQRPEPEDGEAAGSQFVLYMGSRQGTGDYMGVALHDQKVQWVYRLGPAGPATLSIDESIGEQFSAVSIARSLQFGHMSITVEKQMVHETKGDTVAPGPEGLLSLAPDDFVFYVGGYPKNFTPPEPLRLDSYRGCIELDTLNEQVVSLYNFEETFHLDTTADKPCARSKSTGDPWLTDGSYLDGTGYAYIPVESQTSSTKRFEQELRLVSADGIIFFLQHQGQFLCLAVRDSILRLYYDFGHGLQEAPPSPPSTSTATSTSTLPPFTSASKAIQVYLLRSNRQQRVLVRLERVSVFSVEQDYALESAEAYYLGGVPPSQLPPSLRKLFPSGGSIRACVKGIKALGKYVDLKRLNTTGISFGCTSDLLMERTMTFHGGAFLSLPLHDVPPLSEHFYSGFGFRSSRDSGRLYHRRSSDGVCEVSLQQGRVSLRLPNAELKTRGPFADGAPHYVAFYSNTSGAWLYVDDQLQQMKPHRGTALNPSQPVQSPPLFLGGLPDSRASQDFEGCISNVFVQRLQGPQQVLNLQERTSSVNVSSGCAPKPGTDAPALVPRGLRVSTAQKGSRQSRKPSADPTCSVARPPRSVPGAYQLGGALPSHLEFSLPQHWSHLSLLVRPRAPHGLLLFAAPRKAGGPSLLLFLNKGYFIARVEGAGIRHRHIQSHQKARMGRWHMVSVKWDKTGVHLVTHLAKAQPAPTQHLHWPESPRPNTLFIGGLPAGNPERSVAGRPAFSGCVKTLKLDGRPLDLPRKAVGVTPCFLGPLEKGLFFAASGGALSLDLPGVTLSTLELVLELRPRSAKGLVLHLGGEQTPPYLQLQLVGTQVLLQADQGSGEVSTWVTLPTALCDGLWHRVAVTSSGHTLRLEVDTHTNQTLHPTMAAAAATPAQLHLGGLPEPTFAQAEASTQTHPRPPAYSGCMRNLVLNGTSVSWSRSASTQGAVGASGCPVG